ncbi:MAG: protealysin inhibitor emfourin [Acidimicrobiia bacterium]
MVEFSRSGGVAGVTVRAAVDAADLTAEEAAGLVVLAGLEPAGAARSRDRFSYRVATVEGDRRNECTFAEEDVPPSLRPLLERLTRAALSR